MKRFAMVAILAAVWSGASSAQKPVEELLASMRKAYQSVQTATLQIAIKLDNQNGIANGVIQVEYARPNKIRYGSEIGANTVRRFSNGKRVVTIRPNGRQISDKVDVDTLGGQVQGNLEWLCFFDWKRQLSTGPGTNMEKSTFKPLAKVNWKGKEWILLEESAPSMGLFVRYTIDPKSFFIWRCQVHLLSNNKKVTETEVQKLVLGGKIDPARFEAPPEAKGPAKP